MDSHPSPRVARDAPRLIQDVIADPSAIRIVTQPILDLVDGRIAGYEALSRFDRRTGWSPQHWFQCAHRCGLGARLEAAAIDAALSVPFRPAASVLTVNVSPSTLGTRALGEVLPDDLSGLMFELTENEPISGDPSLPTTIRNYRRRGAHFALDDVGAGHARLADVRLVAPELVKLDRSLITGLELDPVRAAAAESLIHAAMSTGAAVCAEGVETLQQLRWLHRAGVTQVQGYLLGRPQTGWATDTSLTDTVRLAKTPGLLELFDVPRRRGSASGRRSRWTTAKHASVRRLGPTMQ
ncbi:EAL domain-containing protein [Solirubrobacter taibaiensis]|nr:EAL domain-containing protein [Solirubrobacter taibaiensis]